MNHLLCCIFICSFRKGGTERQISTVWLVIYVLKYNTLFFKLILWYWDNVIIASMLSIITCSVELWKKTRVMIFVIILTPSLLNSKSVLCSLYSFFQCTVQVFWYFGRSRGNSFDVFLTPQKKKNTTFFLSIIFFYKMTY